MINPVTSKENYYKRWMAGEFGNKPLTWATLSELQDSTYRGLVNIRHISPGSSLTQYNVPKSKCASVIRSSLRPKHEFRFNEPLPDDRLVVQGEILYDYKGWHLHYSREKIQMRPAMQNALYCKGLAAMMLLRGALDATSFDWCQELVQMYDGHVIEFSTYAVPVGNLHLNTIIWEVRKY